MKHLFLLRGSVTSATTTDCSVHCIDKDRCMRGIASLLLVSLIVSAIAENNFLSEL